MRPFSSCGPSARAASHRSLPNDRMVWLQAAKQGIQQPPSLDAGDVKGETNPYDIDPSPPLPTCHASKCHALVESNVSTLLAHIVLPAASLRATVRHF